MKNIRIFACLACALMISSCGTDDTLEDTRVADVEAPAVSLNNVAVEKYDATFDISLTSAGNPAVREYGVMVSEQAQPTIDNSVVFTTDKSEASGKIRNTFSPGTTYYACAYALTANKLVTSEVKSFTTESHPLGAFIGKKTLSGYNLHENMENTSISVTLTPDEEDETILYMTGLKSNAGVALDLGKVKLVFDLEAGTVTIPQGQVVDEKNYGAYMYIDMDVETADPILQQNIVGVIEDGVIYFDALGAIIVQGGNAGLYHWAFLYPEIK